MAQARVTRQNALVFGSARGTVEAKGLRTFDAQFLRNDWSEPVLFTTHWQTSLERSYSNLREESQSLKTRATHTIEARTMGWDQGESFQHFASAMRGAQNQFPIPLYCDRARLTGNSSSNFVPCDPIYRRFYVGQRVALVRQDFQKVSISSTQVFCEYGLVTDITSEGITLEDNLNVSWSTGDWAYPMLDCHPLVTTDGSLVTDHHLSTSIIATEQGGQSALPPTFRNDVTHLWNYENNRPVVDFNEWTDAPELSIEAQGGIRSSGKGEISDIQGEFPLARWTFSPLMKSRKEAWELLSLFDAMRGRGKQLYLLSPLSPFTVQGRGSTYIDIDPVDNVSTFNDGWIAWIGLDFGDRKKYVRQVLGAEEINGGSTFRITLGDPGITESSPLLRATVCHRCRFAEDSLTIEWLTDEISRAQFSLLDTRESYGLHLIKNKPHVYPSFT